MFVSEFGVQRIHIFYDVLVYGMLLSFILKGYESRELCN